MGVFAWFAVLSWGLLMSDQPNVIISKAEFEHLRFVEGEANRAIGRLVWLAEHANMSRVAAADVLAVVRDLEKACGGA